MMIFAYCPCFIVCLIASFHPLSYARIPNVLSNPSSRTWNIHSIDSQLFCVVFRFTDGKVRWLKDREFIMEDDRISITPGDADRSTWDFGRRMRYNASKLTFRYLKKTDEGRYECRVYDDDVVYTSRKRIIRIVVPPTVNVGNPLPSSISAEWGDHLALQCDGRGPPDITHVQWSYTAYKNDIGKQSLAFQGVKIMNTEDTLLRSLPEAHRAMSYGVVHYKVFCTVRNREGKCDSQTTTIFIKQRPQTPVVDHVVTLGTGEDVQLFWKIISRPCDVETCWAYIDRSSISITLTQPYDPDLNNQTISGLVPASTSSVRIRCVNEFGKSEYSEMYVFNTGGDMPTNVVVEPLNSTSLRVSWDPTPFDLFNGLPTKHSIMLRKTQGPELTREVAGDENAIVFHKLIPGDTYGASVREVSSSKDGRYSKMKYVTLPLFEKPIIICVSAPSEKQAVFTIKDINDKEDTFHNCSLFLSHDYQIITVDVEIARHATTWAVEFDDKATYAVKLRCYTYEMQLIDSDTKNVSHESLAPHNLNVKILDHSILAKWSPPDTKCLEDNHTVYIVCVIVTVKSSNDDNVCFNSTDTSYEFTMIQPDAEYIVSVSACTMAGCGPNATEVISTDSSSIYVTSSKPDTTLILAIIVAVVLTIVIIVILAVFRHKRSPKNDSQAPAIFTASPNEQPYEVPLLHPTWTDTNSTYDIPSSPSFSLSDDTYNKLANVKYDCGHVTLKKEIGDGQFGRVYKAEFAPFEQHVETTDSDVVDVAVKTMKMHYCPYIYEQREYDEFVREGLRMKDMDHPNVMRLLGICLPAESNTANDSQSNVKLSGLDALSPWIILPFMPNGDLKQHLYKARKDAKTIELKQILQFAHDIACGMEYITKKKIIHRDLACRNCMLDANMNVVISDFGLSRAVYSSNYYKQRHPTKVPIKWLAMESLMDNIYTSMTDVWSFGVTAWELFTLCRSPFPGVQNHEMLDLLTAGKRLSKPELCPNDVWNDAIYPCWDSSGDERPTFSELADMFAAFKSSHRGNMTELPRSSCCVKVQPAVNQQ